MATCRRHKGGKEKENEKEKEKEKEKKKKKKACGSLLLVEGLEFRGDVLSFLHCYVGSGN